MPNGTYGGVRGRRLITASYSIALFRFCGRKNDCMKGLLWEGGGFLLLYKRLANGRYQWPRSEMEIRRMNTDQYRRLVTGFAIDSTIHPSIAKCAG